MQTTKEHGPDLSVPYGNLAVSIGRSTIFGIVSKFAQISTRLFTIPIVVSHLGLAGYGIWSIIMTTSAYMRFGSVGIKSAFQKYVADATGNGDFQTASRLLSTGTAVMAILSMAGLIPSALLSHKLAVAAGVPPEFLSSATSSITVLAFIMMLSNVGAVYEAIVMGGHRIDLVRKFSTITTIAEAVAIIILLHFGYGLFAMASVMAISELCYLGCCYVASKKIVPEIELRYKYITKSVLRELVRFAGSYQLVNILEVLYGAILPITVLRNFGATVSGALAIAGRLVVTAAMLPDSFLHPILSGGSMLYASGSTEGMRQLIRKSYKMALGLSLFPLVFLSVFGSSVVYTWTGQVDPSFQPMLVLMSVNSFFGIFSILGLVLYRVSGHAILDNVRQLLRIFALLIIALFASKLGLYGVLIGWSTTEMIGMLFMIFALMRTFPAFHIRDLLPDTLRVTAATAIMLAAGGVFASFPSPAIHNSRTLALFQLGKVTAGCLLAAWPALLITKAITRAEGTAIIKVLVPRRFRPDYVVAHE